MTGRVSCIAVVGYPNSPQFTVQLSNRSGLAVNSFVESHKMCGAAVMLVDIVDEDDEHAGVFLSFVNGTGKVSATIEVSYYAHSHRVQLVDVTAFDVLSFCGAHMASGAEVRITWLRGPKSELAVIKDRLVPGKS
jgi:hypothetical protein